MIAIKEKFILILFNKNEFNLIATCQFRFLLHTTDPITF
jgi:hypothetical protein